MTAIGDLLTRETRARLLEHLADADDQELDRLAELAALMRQPGGLPSAPEPPPLHRTGRGEATR